MFERIMDTSSLQARCYYHKPQNQGSIWGQHQPPALDLQDGAQFIGICLLAPSSSTCLTYTHTHIHLFLHIKYKL